MLIVSQETLTEASPTNCCLMSKGARGCAETLISLHIPQACVRPVCKCPQMQRLHQQWLCNRPYSEKISAYGHIAQAAHYIRVVFLMNCLPACVISAERRGGIKQGGP